ncbi:two-component response regulator ARR12-like [Ananas comosus]|uniref:Two-component response regulator ARR12-like n=1 Tax=Ananas comosus TaxID=4615 RepID=A0A6P5FN69_ANACO|nr:two-component response regulator ARR12-like [Ananas comosus]XP_020094524.1 two-component response regulator ARR12-like [Ananas comosus]XP_020094525.1 two-component response regulator ARR12-like [Ananas comosus]XP_020094526.1 two-component response regulator ARR12-like [Ananas comosus]XP_020094527.1 two-component response regulator ARR12-like [Ananas comosus]XP_020094528.1 two-component response regulator ARR12-like [Ananas comosus]XP_020094529.1 two-component response regulator ARR12-like 
MPALPSPEDMTALPPPEAARESAPPPPPQGRVPLSEAPTLRAATTLVQQMASGCAASPAASVAVDIMNKALPDHIHVLVVDGDSTSLKALESSLLAHNYKVTTCSEGTEALSMLRKGEVKFHLVLSDTYLPDMIGCKFLNCVTSETYLPVIMMSAEPDEEAEAHAAFIHMCFGARGHRRKPLPETVIQDLWQFVMRARLEQMMGPG